MTEPETQPRIALVTGAARRVGKAIALELAKAGLDVIIHYHTSRQESDELAAEILSMGRQAHTIFGDLRNPDSISAMAAELDRHGINIDVLVNSASIYPQTPLNGLTAGEIDDIFAINFRAPLLLCQLLGLKMKSRGWGRIINITDCNVRRVYRNFTPYLASKAALITATEALALELAPEVTVNSIAPGTVLPPDDSSAEVREQALKRSPLQKAGSPEDVAKLVAYLVQEGKFITGSNITVDGGATIR